MAPDRRPLEPVLCPACWAPTRLDMQRDIYECVRVASCGTGTVGELVHLVLLSPAYEWLHEAP